MAVQIAMITNNVYERIFRIRYNERNGTCFTITVDDEMYLITARHIVKEITGCDFVEIYRDSEWKKKSVNLIGHSKSVDISVLTGDLSFSVDLPLPANKNRLIYGQDVYFLGFPNVVNIDDALSFSVKKINRNFPLPIVKHAILSTLGNENHCLIDGYGNPGFSGGPLVYKPRDSNNYHVAGVIVSYKSEIIPVYETQLQAKNDGSGVHPIGYMKGNSGTITVSWIDRAIDLIKNNRG